VILALEMTRTGGAHAVINSAMLQIVATACPGQVVRIYADPTHLEELRQDEHLRTFDALEFVAAPTPKMFLDRTHIVSVARFRQEFAIVRTALAALPAAEPCFVILLSATPTAIWAAGLAARLSGRVAGVHVCLHGNLNDAFGWRTRNPLARRFDLTATLEAKLPAKIRYVVFEKHIVEALERLAPRAAAITDLIPHPVSLGDVPAGLDGQPSLQKPLHVGLVGRGSREKGFPDFLDIVARVTAAFPGECLFHVVGLVQQPFMDAAARAPLVEPPGATPLSREEFRARLRQLHFIMLPFRKGYYDLSASGGLLDALTWLKPVLASRVPLTRDFFAEYGDIGYLSDDLAATVADIVTTVDARRYETQVDALKRARSQRSPEALAPIYRAALRNGFPEFGSRIE
jgi:glycosyltransferase involved in cell wall biosynthesis